MPTMKGLHQVMGNLRRRRELEHQNGHYTAVEALTDVLIWLMEYEAGYYDDHNPRQDKTEQEQDKTCQTSENMTKVAF